MENRAEYLDKYPEMRSLVILQNSDAHALDQMSLDPPKLALAVNDTDDETVRRALIAHLRGENIRFYASICQN